MQRMAMVLGLVVLSLLAGCRGGPPVRVFPPELSVQELRTAGDGESAVNLAQELSPDVLLLDIAMPDLDGIQVARALAIQRPRPAVVPYRQR